MEITLNTEVVVTLTAYGAELLNKRNQAIWDKFKDVPKVKLYGYRTDYKEGDTHHDLLWEIFAMFGGNDKCYNGAQVPFDSIKLFEV